MDKEIFAVALREFLHRYRKAVLSFDEAARAINYRTPQAARTARGRGKFPLRVDGAMGTLTVTVAELARYAVTGEPAAAIASAPFKKRPGRPTKVEQLRRQAALQQDGGK